MHKVVRELVDKAALIGWAYRGDIDGNGHHVLHHEGGAEHPIPATPGDWRSMKNTLASLERIAGRKVPRVNRRRSHKAPERTDFDIDRACREQASWHGEWGSQVDRAHERRAAASDQLRALRDVDTHTARNAAKKLISQILAAEQVLTDYHQPFTPFHPNDLEESA